MKKMISHQLLWALFFTGALAFSSCEDNGDDMILPYIEPVKAISSEGGVLRALNNNVVLSIPAGAIDYPEYFTINVCEGTGNCPYLLHPIVIEPFVTFKKPVELSIRYSGCLCNGNAFDCQKTCVNVCNWQNSQDFLEKIPANSCNATINQTTGTIDLTIYQTGVFAITNE